MDDSLYNTMMIKLADQRDPSPIMVLLAPYLDLSDWLDQQLEMLEDDYQRFQTPRSQRLSTFQDVAPQA